MCLLTCGPEKKKKAKNPCQGAGAPSLTDKRCARSSFGITTTCSLPSFVLQGLASRYRPSTVTNQSGVSCEAPVAHTIKTAFSRPGSSTKPRRFWATVHDSYHGFRLGH